MLKSRHMSYLDVFHLMRRNDSAHLVEVRTPPRVRLHFLTRHTFVFASAQVFGVWSLESIRAHTGRSFTPRCRGSSKYIKLLSRWTLGTRGRYYVSRVPFIDVPKVWLRHRSTSPFINLMLHGSSIAEFSPEP